MIQSVEPMTEKARIIQEHPREVLTLGMISTFPGLQISATKTRTMSGNTSKTSLTLVAEGAGSGTIGGIRSLPFLEVLSTSQHSCSRILKKSLKISLVVLILSKTS